MKPVELNDAAIAADKILREHLSKTGELLPPTRSLLDGLGDLLEYRRSKAPSMDLENGAKALVTAWRKEPSKPIMLTDVVTEKDTRKEMFRNERNRVNRVTSVQITNFRGWCKSGGHCVDVDADLVLLAGPNGRGKSSFLEALVLGLTGYTRHEDSNALWPRNRNGDLSCEVKVAVDAQNDESGRREPLCFKLPMATPDEKDWDSTHPLCPTLPRSHLWHEFHAAVGNARTAEAREADLSAVFGDQLHDRFELDKSVDKLLTAFSTAGQQLAELRKVIDEAHQDMAGEIEKRKGQIAHARDPQRDEFTRVAVLNRFDSARSVLDEFRVAYGRFEPTRAALPQLPPLTGSDEERLPNIRGALNAWGEALGLRDRPQLLDAIKLSIKSWKKTLLTTNEELGEKFAAKEHELRELLRQYPGAKERIEPFMDSDASRHVSLDLCLGALAENLEKWRKASHRAGLHELTEQLERVIPDDLHRLRDIAQLHVRDHREAMEDIARLDRELEELRRKIEQSEQYQKLSAIENSDELVKLWRALDVRAEFELLVLDVTRIEEENKRAEALKRAFEEAQEALNPFLLHPALREAFENVLNDMLERIQLSPGIVPVAIEKDSGRVVMNDKREVDDLSTGQKTQLAVALSVGINLAISTELGSGVIAMDDVSAAYDVSNIAREAVLWRAVAYGHCARNAMGASNQHDHQRRQLFLSSHNETTTRQLIDLLQPPKGATMKVIRFLGWDNEKGPSYEELEVRCSSPSDPNTRERLAREITHAFRRNRNP